MNSVETSYRSFRQRLGVADSSDKDSLSNTLSAKYRKISEEAEKRFELGLFSTKEIRSWSAQDDLGAPVQIRRLFRLDPFLLENCLRYLSNGLPSRWISRQVQKSALLDDFNVIRELEFDEILQEFPVESTPYVRDIFYYRGYNFNSRHLRYVYLCGQIKRFGLLSNSHDSIHLDIGNFYGGLQVLLKKQFPAVTFINVELPHQLYRSFIFQSQMYPGTRNVVGLQEFRIFRQLYADESAFVYILPGDYEALSHICKVNLLTNYLSLGEMSRENFDAYLESKTTQNAEKIHFVNRFVSSPGLDPTHNGNMTVFDYLMPGRIVEHFDVFPIHRYMLTKRNFLGREAYRNVSSPPFELILS